MRRGILILFFMIVLNMTTLFVNELPVFNDVETMTPYNSSQLTNAINGTDTATNWDPPESGGLFGDQKSTLQSLLTLGGFVDAFPAIWLELGLPVELVNLFSDISVIVWWFTVLDLISGGKIYG